MNERKNKQKQEKYRQQSEAIKKELNDKIRQDEAKLLLHTLIYNFDGFARQQLLINAHMSSKFHWGNKRTARVLKTLAEIEVIDRWKSESDNGSLFFLVKGFSDMCKERIIRAEFSIKKRISHYYSAIITIIHDDWRKNWSHMDHQRSSIHKNPNSPKEGQNPDFHIVIIPIAVSN